jgi:hypothetical protein
MLYTVLISESKQILNVNEIPKHTAEYVYLPKRKKNKFKFFDFYYTEILLYHGSPVVIFKV